MRGKSARKTKKIFKQRHRSLMHKFDVIDKSPFDENIKIYMCTKLAMKFADDHRWLAKRAGVDL